jgi:hypothetical protein
MIQVDRLNLSLGPEFRHRADAIARQLAHELGRLTLSQSMRIDRLSLPVVNVHPHQSNHVIARTIAMHVAQGIRQKGRHYA